MIRNKIVTVAGVEIGKSRLAIIAGPCIIEDLEMAMETAEFLSALCLELNVGFIFKSSYLKANRTSGESYRGPGLEAGLQVLGAVKAKIGCPLIVDVHEPNEISFAATVVDLLQIPAFLCRQTSLLESAGRSGKPVNIKKGQFMTPADMGFAARKVESAGGSGVMLTERGTFFGYGDLVVDMRSVVVMKNLGYPVIFDATHSTQKPGALGGKSGGSREMAFPLARAAVAAGADGVFLEVHPDPDRALSDAASQLSFDDAGRLLREVVRIADVSRDLFR